MTPINHPPMVSFKGPGFIPKTQGRSAPASFGTHQKVDSLWASEMMFPKPPLKPAMGYIYPLLASV